MYELDPPPLHRELAISVADTPPSSACGQCCGVNVSSLLPYSDGNAVGAFFNAGTSCVGFNADGALDAPIPTLYVGRPATWASSPAPPLAGVSSFHYHWERYALSQWSSKGAWYSLFEDHATHHQKTTTNDTLSYSATTRGSSGYNNSSTSGTRIVRANADPESCADIGDGSPNNAQTGGGFAPAAKEAVILSATSLKVNYYKGAADQDLSSVEFLSCPLPSAGGIYHASATSGFWGRYLENDIMSPPYTQADLLNLSKSKVDAAAWDVAYESYPSALHDAGFGWRYSYVGESSYIAENLFVWPKFNDLFYKTAAQFVSYLESLPDFINSTYIIRGSAIPTHRYTKARHRWNFWNSYPFANPDWMPPPFIVTDYDIAFFPENTFEESPIPPSVSIVSSHSLTWKLEYPTSAHPDFNWDSVHHPMWYTDYVTIDPPASPGRHVIVNVRHRYAYQRDFVYNNAYPRIPEPPAP
jgi:hypothetical protein